jgi:hypothetical protein
VTTIGKSQALAKALAVVVREELAARDARLLAHEARISVLEEQLRAGGAKSLLDCYKGVWRTGSTYVRGSLATHQGGLWFATKDTEDRPGASSHWVLAVKSGGK